MKISDCRVCLSSNQTTLPLTINVNTGRKNEKMPIIEIYEFVLKSKIADIEIQDCPGSICLGCMNKLLTAYNFINQAKISEETIANKLEVSQILQNLTATNGNDNQNHSGPDTRSSSIHQPKLGSNIIIKKVRPANISNNFGESSHSNIEVGPGTETSVSTRNNLRSENTSTPQNQISIKKRKLSKDLTPLNISTPVNNNGNCTNGDTSIVISDDENNLMLSDGIQKKFKCVTCNLKFQNQKEKAKHFISSSHKNSMRMKKLRSQKEFEQKRYGQIKALNGTPRKLRKRVNSI